MTEKVPEYMRIRQYVLNRIYQARELTKLPSEREFCDMFKVCRKTVRRAFSDLCKEGTIIAQPRCGYFVKPDSGPKVGKSIGLIIIKGMNITYDRHFLRLLNGITSVLSERLAPLQLLNFSKIECIPEEISRLAIDGIIWIIEPESYDLFLDIPFPAMAVSFVGVPESGNVVFNDLSKGLFIAYEHLIKCGHRNILYITAGCDPEFEVICRRGAEKALIKHKIPINKQLFLEGSPDSMDAQLRTLFQDPPPFTAAYCRSSCCELFYRTVKEAGLILPDNFELITEDDQFSLSYNPNLTRLYRPLEKMGYDAADKLLDIIEHKIETPYRQEFKWEVINKNHHIKGKE